MLTQEDKNQLRQVINKKIERARLDISELEEATRPIPPENAIGRVSRMDAINNKSVNEAALRQTRDKLLKLENCLKMMDRSNFGMCFKCGKPIPTGRLFLMPESTKCTNCA